MRSLTIIFFMRSFQGVGVVDIRFHYPYYIVSSQSVWYDIGRPFLIVNLFRFGYYLRICNAEHCGYQVCRLELTNSVVFLQSLPHLYRLPVNF